MSRRFRFRVRVGSAYFIDGEWYGAGDEFVVSDDKAALVLRGKGRRGVEIVEVLDDRPATAQERRKLP